MIVLTLLYYILQPTLTVTVNGIETASGQVAIAIYDSEESYMDESKIYAYKFVPVNSTGSVEAEFALPEGKYAISVFHDVNGDGELNKTLVGVPKEPYGFSNNARATFSAPGFSEASLHLKSDQQTSITVK